MADEGMTNIPEAKPRELRAAVAFLWAAFAAGLVGAAIDLMSMTEPTGLVVVAIPSAFTLFVATVTYYFSRARHWARVASLILLVFNLLGALDLPSLFDRAPVAGWLYVSELLLQALAMYLAFATPASKAFQRSSGDDPAMRAILPVGRSGWAIAAGYLALFSILLVPAPFALAAGLLAIRDIRRNPRKHGMGRAVFGIVMGSLGVLALLALLVLVGWRLAR